ncbi:glycine betaine ABC transporter substrate-binding protein OsmF [Crenalkalicoccus roseus]|uniref:glycine betaine ABC transporter substrate-binding protein OsmF n=1 Tax=Crenalkalicoccus roseus TaxID=1485588 RepID=UPI0010814C45|nr:ABC transporter substrate-binding protein [Crenalkalicoccus roseus]
MERRILGRRRLGLLLGAAPALAALPARAQGRERVVVASKLDTEGALLGHMILLALEAEGVPVENRLQLGPTRVVREALLAGEIDLYPEYTGNGAFFFRREEDPAWRSPQAAYDMVRRLDAEANRLVWLDRAPANNTWAIAVRGDVARREGLATMEDFAAAAGRGVLRLAASAEFVESPAALPAFERAYGFAFPRERIVVLPGGDTAVTMRAAAQGIGGVNAAMVYGTDGAIAALGLVVMADSRGAQIVYEPAPVARAAVLERHPRIAPALGRIFPGLTAETLRALNARIAVEGQPPREVARRHLAEAGLLR